MADLDSEKIAVFVGIARAKRGFPFSAEAASETILTHINLMVEQRLTNAAILLFAKNPQQFSIRSEIKCAHFHGTTITKPIPSYHVYKGDVFQLVNQAVDFVLSRIDVSVGTRDQSIKVPIHYELPPAAVTEAIFNAVAHRDYTSNGSIQVMLFKDRLEIWNPGSLSYGLTTAKLRKPHSSIPANPLLAEPMYLAGFIERMGTGTGDIILLCEEAGLKKPPEFLQEEIFKTILWRKNAEDVVAVGVSGGVNDILVLIENHPGINVSALKSHLDIPQRTIERWINQLKKENKIEFKGAPKTGGIIG
jgi:ATP-dependent DNA helicase RecG